MQRGEGVGKSVGEGLCAQEIALSPLAFLNLSSPCTSGRCSLLQIYSASDASKSSWEWGMVGPCVTDSVPFGCCVL